MKFQLSNYFLKKDVVEGKALEFLFWPYFKVISAKLLGALCGTVLAVFIPVLHFVLVPLGILYIVYLLYRLFRHPLGEILLDEALCLECSAKLPMKLEVYSWPVQVKCTQCQCLHYIDR